MEGGKDDEREQRRKGEATERTDEDDQMRGQHTHQHTLAHRSQTTALGHVSRCTRINTLANETRAELTYEEIKSNHER